MNPEIDKLLNDVISDSRHSDLLERAVAYTNKYDELQHLKVVRGIEKAVAAGLLPDVNSPDVQLFILAELIGSGTKEVIAEFASILKGLDTAGESVRNKIVSSIKTGSKDLNDSLEQNIKHIVLPLITRSIEDKITESLDSKDGTIFTEIDNRLKMHSDFIKELDKEFNGYADKIVSAAINNSKRLSEINDNLKDYTDEVNRRHVNAINTVAKNNIQLLDDVYKGKIKEVEGKFTDHNKKLGDSVADLQNGLIFVINKQQDIVQKELSKSIQEVAKNANEAYKENLRISWIHKILFSVVFAGSVFATHTFSYDYGKKDSIDKTAEILVNNKVIKEDQTNMLKSMIYKDMLSM
jgi:hypothetical protein